MTAAHRQTSLATLKPRPRHVAVKNTSAEQISTANTVKLATSLLGLVPITTGNLTIIQHVLLLLVFDHRHTLICIWNPDIAADNIYRAPWYFDYEQNTTRCKDTSPQTLCPNNFYSASNNTCCDKSQGIVEINYHNEEAMPKTSADLSSYYALAGYTVPTDGIYQTVITSSTSTSSTSATTATGTTTSATTGPSAVYSPDPTPSPDLSNGAKAGIGVGAAAGILAVAGALIFLFMRRRKSLKNSQQQHAMSSDPQYDAVPQEPGLMQEHKTSYHGPSELPHEPAKRAELSDKQVSEMAG
ncbi:MAG: hypothetical protein L6R36_007726 [Xanthoria steineri]|nr:MAG: hypothetical protein L6R36_008571 [Xanthoria steineri]KAI4220284.1 MAG: hypothetical protein L6R36_007726 [Xanthoria steineri]